MSNPTILYQAEHQIVPPGFKRGDTALILLHQDDSWILGKKEIYPEQIVRLVGGGIDVGESPAQAAQRELEEELGIRLESSEFHPVVQVNAVFTEYETGSSFQHTSNVFYASVSASTKIQPADDLHGVAHLSDEEYLNLLDRYLAIPSDLIQDPPGFRWIDYGKYYAIVHREAHLQARLLQHK